jgi:hypothetical protein
MKKKVYKNTKQRLTKQEKEKRKINLIVYLLLRILVIMSMIGQGLNHNWNNVLLCILTLLLFTVPNFVSKRFHIKFPETLEIIVYLFIFSAEILGEIQNFYGIFVHWDTILHTLNGFLCAAIGFSLVDILNHNEDFQINMSPAFAALVAFSFSMTVGVVWEFAEYAADNCLGKDMQKDKIVQEIRSIKINPEGVNIPVVINNIEKTEIYSKNGHTTTIEGGYLDIGVYDTMKDLIVNFIGAFIFSVFGYLYVKNREGYRFLDKFIPKKQ